MLNASRIATIAQTIFDNAENIKRDLLAKADAQAITNKAKDDYQSNRERIMATVANLSSQDNWTDMEIKAACKAASELNKGNDKASVAAIRTFINDCQRAAHPLVRDRFDELYALVKGVWDEEDQLKGIDSDIPAPVHKLFKRRYHALLATFKLVIDQVHPINDPEDLVDYAKDNDPDWDAGKIAKQLKDIVSKLSDINVDFPLNVIADAVRTLGTIEEEDLKSARHGKSRVSTSVATTVVKAKPVVAPTASFAGRAKDKPVVTTETEVDQVNAAMDVMFNDPHAELAEAA